MSAIKISSRVDEQVWEDLRALADESQRSVSGLLTEAIKEFVRRRRIRPDVLQHLDNSMNDNEALGKLLAQ